MIKCVFCDKMLELKEFKVVCDECSKGIKDEAEKIKYQLEFKFKTA